MNNPLIYTDPSGHQNEDDDEDEYTLEEITVTAERPQTSVFAYSTTETWPTPTWPEVTIPPLVSTLGKAITSPAGAAIIVGAGIVLWPSQTSADSELTAEEKAEYDKKQKEERAKDALNASPPAPGMDNDDKDHAQDKKLSNGEINKLKNEIRKDGLRNIEELKSPGGKGAGGLDLYKKPNGDIVIKPKGGSGPGEPTGYNIKNF